MDADLVATTVQYMIGYAAGCASGYGFSVKMHNEILTIHKEQIQKLEERIKRFEEVFYPNFCERRKNRGDCPAEIDRRKRDD